MTQWNAVDRERSGRGPGCDKFVAVLFSTEREHSSFSTRKTDRRMHGTHTIARILKKIAKLKTPTFHEHRLFLPRKDHKEGAPT